ncbi:MAG: hypothetical protein HQL10_13420 [Nitrospirae bacterium]|nr:hypothetical protein [Nitrospirota bacterium]
MINKKKAYLIIVGILVSGVALFFKKDLSAIYYKATHSGVVQWHNIQIDLPENYIYEKFTDAANKLIIYNSNGSGGQLNILQRNIKDRTVHDILDLYDRAFPGKVLESKEINFRNQKRLVITRLSGNDSYLREETFIFSYNLLLQVACSEKAYCREFDRILEHISFKE